MPGQPRHHEVGRSAGQERRIDLAKFMDVHNGFFGVTAEQLAEAHQRDLELQDAEGVVYEQAWLDPESGKVFCLATGPSREAVMRVHERAGHPTPEVYAVTVEV
jgi:Nickel responsive protein SCO4226-like